MNEVGEKLKEARKAKGYTLDDLQQMTKIQKRYLIAVEEGKLDVLPGNFYARAFIKQYADTVGLDGEQLLKDHSDIPAPKSEEITEQVRTTQTRTKPKENGMMSTIQDSLPTILIILLVLGIALAFYIAVSSNSGDNDSSVNQDESAQNNVNVESNENAENAQPEVPADTDDEDTEEEPEPEPEPENPFTIAQESSTGGTTTYTVSGPLPDDKSLTLNAEGGESWVSITVDGTTAEQALLSGGESISTDLTEEVETVAIVIGNAAVTTVQLSGQSVEYAPESANAVKQDLIFNFEQ
ncbi:helix-turn-helix domain-containing protein [Marinilactibacillus sp. Marseille-P9653]|uniref:helix-turn-helix domain-containing protein n=1 Tax=Marinilactibacillus sp. Marseille-P9653 TaxID=2866583 RepID=UPI001CE43179|nr:helix-turn-helix domain-containing protein [Marinilactibacillus sp. Marseille-P9653]